MQDAGVSRHVLARRVERLFFFSLFSPFDLAMAMVMAMMQCSEV
jgi:hypothetical protein